MKKIVSFMTVVVLLFITGCINSQETSTDNTLKSLVLTNVSGEVISFDKKFVPSVLSYSAKVDTTVNEITINAEANDEKAKVGGIGDFEVGEGVNNYDVPVTAENGIIRIYKIKITKTNIINITATVSGITLNITSAGINIGNSITLAAIVTMNPENATKSAVTYTSNNIAVAEVTSKTGIVTAKAKGTAVITVKAGNVSETAIINVIENVITPSAIPFAWYKIDGNSDDSSKNNLNGTVLGNLSYVTGKSGMAGDFDATDDYININSAKNINLEKFTVAAWLQSDNGKRTCAYLNLPGNFHIRTNDGRWDIILDSSDWSLIDSGYSFVADEWHHFAVTVDNIQKRVEFYVDGVKIGTTHSFENAMQNQITPFKAFIGQFSKEYMWDGRIDDVRFFEANLSESEIKNIYGESAVLDVEKPSTPQSVTCSAVSQNMISLQWNPSTDNSGISKYLIYRNGIKAGETKNEIYTDAGLNVNTEYLYTVASVDTSGNISDVSKVCAVKTLNITDVQEIVFITEGSSFAPVISVTGSAVVTWTWADGTTSGSVTPSKDYVSSGKRINKLLVEPWSALERINIGYDAGDAGTNKIEFVGNQNVSDVQGLEIVAPYLRQWCSSYNQIESLDFSNFINLDTIECFLSQSLKSVNLTNTPKLARACFEDCDLQVLDVSGCPNLEDLRGAQNSYTGINFGNTKDKVWHICIRDNPQIVQAFPSFRDFKKLRELFIWNTNQSGVLELATEEGCNVLAAENKYTTADFSACNFESGANIEMPYNNLEKIYIASRNGVTGINLNNNKLIEIDITGIYTINTFYANNNSLTDDAVDNILTNLNLSIVNNGTVELTGVNNGYAGEKGKTAIAGLKAKGWTVNVKEKTVVTTTNGIVINHLNTKINQITASAINAAKEKLAIYYGHTSHGSQLITAMDGLDAFMGGKGMYTYNSVGSNGALKLIETSPDAGYYPEWMNNTTGFLGVPDSNGRGTDRPDINVVMWSWCGQLGWMSQESVKTDYLEPMAKLEADYPGIKFVYFTGHLDGTGVNGTLNKNNNLIREWCNNGGKWLYDFADIESYDPAGNGYLDKGATDACFYDSDGYGTTDKNWSEDWQTANPGKWYNCSPAHAESAHAMGNMKAYAAWWLFARLAGWDGK